MKIVLGPWKHDPQKDRQYDLIRGVILFGEYIRIKKNKIKNESKALTAKRNDISVFNKLKTKYPIINVESLNKIAHDFKYKIVIIDKPTTRAKPVVVYQTENAHEHTMNVIAKYFNEPNDYLLTDLTLVTDEADLEIQIYNNIKKKVKQAYSLVDAINFARNTKYTEDDFRELWGDDKVRFRDEDKFHRMFKFGFNFWYKPARTKQPAVAIYSSWYTDSSHFFLTTEQIDRNYVHMFDYVQVVLDPSYVLRLICSKCEIYRAKKKSTLIRHEKTCSNETKFEFVQKSFGTQGNIRADLISEGIIDPNDDSHRRFVAFDIESVNDTSSGRSVGFSTIIGTQQIISIGYRASFGDYRGVILREDMTRKGGVDLLSVFVDKMKELQRRHYERLPRNIKQAMAEYKLRKRLKCLSVSEKKKICDRFYYLKSITRLKIIGLNSAKYDLPCMMTYLIEAVGAEKVKPIKKGSSYFELKVEMLSFRDCNNYTGPISLANFANIFKLQMVKSIFPYEKFQSIDEMRQQILWPKYSDFYSTLYKKHQIFTEELGQILTTDSDLHTVADLFKRFDFQPKSFPEEYLKKPYLDVLSEEQKMEIYDYFNISPLIYLEQEKFYTEAISTGQFKNFVDYLSWYNLLDCDLLMEAMSKFIRLFETFFGATILDRLSLPGVSESIMWGKYDKTSPKMFSFNDKYGFLNTRIREKLQGGPTIIFHRHAEIKLIGNYVNSVYKAANGDKYKRIVSYDFNALYAYSMKQNLPCGIPFYYEKNKNGTFTSTITAEANGWSHDAMDWINHMSYDKRFQKSDGTYYQMLSAITGEYKIPGTNYSADGYVETDRKKYFLEYFGCRFHECSLCKTVPVRTNLDDDNKKISHLKSLGELILIRGCQWKKPDRLSSPYSQFYYTKEVSTDMILSAVRKDRLFGLIELDITTPSWLQDDFDDINFAPIFNKISVTEDMLSTTTIDRCKAYGVKLPTNPQLTVVYEAKNYLITTDMLKYYLELGLQVTNIHYCIEYQRAQPLKKFIELSE